MNKEYLYHGSPVKVDKLVPNEGKGREKKKIVTE